MQGLELGVPGPLGAIQNTLIGNQTHRQTTPGGGGSPPHPIYLPMARTRAIFEKNMMEGSSGLPIIHKEIRAGVIFSYFIN